MKIALFHNLPSGGGKRVIYELSKRLARQNVVHEYTLSTSSDYLSLAEFVHKTYIFNYQVGHNFFEYLFNTLFKLKNVHKKIAEKINNGNYDIAIVTHDFLTKSPYLLNYLTVKSIYICHEPQREYYESIFLHATTLKDFIINFFRLPIKFIDRKNARKATVILVNSKYSKEVIERIYKRKAYVLFPGCDIKVFKKIRVKKENMVMSVGSLLPYKGHEFLIQSISMIRENIRPDLIIVGGGRDSERRRISNLSRKRGVTLRVVDRLSDKNLVILYNKAKVLLVGAILEPFGLSILESMACGTPAVAVREGGVGEQIIHGKNGYFCARNKLLFANYIIKAMKFSTKLGNRAISDVKKGWTWDHSYNQLNLIMKDQFGL